MRLRSLAILLALVGCADDNVSVFVVGVAAPTAEEGTCSYDTSSYLTSGLYDPSRGNSYAVFPVVENGLFERESGIRPETNGVFIRDAVVSMLDTQGGSLGDAFSVPVNSAYIPPGGQAVVGIEAIPASYATLAAGAGVVVLEIELHGETQGGIDIETGSFRWTVSVCSGCLFPGCVPADEATGSSLGDCAPGSNFPQETICAP